MLLLMKKKVVDLAMLQHGEGEGWKERERERKMTVWCYFRRYDVLRVSMYNCLVTTHLKSSLRSVIEQKELQGKEHHSSLHRLEVRSKSDLPHIFSQLHMCVAGRLTA